MSRLFLIRNAGMFINCCLLIIVVACTQAKRSAGIYEQYAVSFSAFRESKLASHAKTDSSASFQFPLLEFYNQAGHRVFSGHEARTNALALQDTEKLEAASPPPTSPELNQTLMEIAQIAPSATVTIPYGRGTVFAMNLDRCQACSLQDDYLSSVQSKLLQNGINVVKVNVSRTITTMQKGH